MPYISEIQIENHYKVPDLKIVLADPALARGWRHLILTGPNGSGKTTVIERIAGEVERNVGGKQAPSAAEVRLQINNLKAQLEGSPAESPEAERLREALRRREAGLNQFGVALQWTQGALPHQVQAFHQGGRLVAAFLRADRQTKMAQVIGPTSKRYAAVGPISRIGEGLLQYLVNRNVDARLDEKDDPRDSEATYAWLAELEQALAVLFEIPGLRLQFTRKPEYAVQFVEPGRKPYAFDVLAAGHASILAILGELILRIDGSTFGLSRNSESLSGVVMIDEPELHLHPELQEKILPFLTAAFPRLQFIVTTHSPAVLSSIDGALVVDLASLEQVTSESLQGTPYGELMQTHFGLELDLDLKSTEKLRVLDRLAKLPEPSLAEAAQLAALAEELRKTSHPLALEVWNRLELARLEAGE